MWSLLFSKTEIIIMRCHYNPEILRVKQGSVLGAWGLLAQHLDAQLCSDFEYDTWIYIWCIISLLLEYYTDASFEVIFYRWANWGELLFDLYRQPNTKFNNTMTW